MPPPAIGCAPAAPPRPAAPEAPEAPPPAAPPTDTPPLPPALPPVPPLPPALPPLPPRPEAPPPAAPPTAVPPVPAPPALPPPLPEAPPPAAPPTAVPARPRASWAVPRATAGATSAGGTAAGGATDGLPPAPRHPLHRPLPPPSQAASTRESAVRRLSRRMRRHSILGAPVASSGMDAHSFFRAERSGLRRPRSRGSAGWRPSRSRRATRPRSARPTSPRARWKTKIRCGRSKSFAREPPETRRGR